MKNVWVQKKHQTILTLSEAFVREENIVFVVSCLLIFVSIADFWLWVFFTPKMFSYKK